MQAAPSRARRRRCRAPLAALAASLALHVVVFLLLPSWHVVPPPREQARSFAIELHPVPAGAVPAEPATPSATRPRDRSRRRVIVREPSARSEGAAPPGDPARDLVAEGIAPAPSVVVPDLHARPPPPPAGRGDAADASPPAEAALGTWAREQAGRARVENGVVHPYYRDVGRALLHAWDAERTIEEHGLSGYVAQLADDVRTYGRIWQRSAEGFAKTGAPGIVDGGSARMKELSGLPPGPVQDALVQAEIRRQLRPAWSEGHVTIIRVTQAADGRLLSVELVSPSKDAAMDRAAIADVRTAARRLPAPPAEALAGRERLVSLWGLELEVSISPPLPVVRIEFDEVLGLKDVRLPLDRRIWKRVRLLAVE